MGEECGGSEHRGWGCVCVCVCVVETEWDESVLYDLETEVADGGTIYNEAERRFLSGGCLSQVNKSRRYVYTCISPGKPAQACRARREMDRAHFSR